MSQTQFAEMMEASVSWLLDECINPRSIAPRLASQWPFAAPLEIVLAMVSAADAVEAMITNGLGGRRAQQVWRHAAILATDLHAMDRLGLPRRTGADLIAYWHSHDPFFLSTEADFCPDT